MALNALDRVGFIVQNEKNGSIKRIWHTVGSCQRNGPRHRSVPKDCGRPKHGSLTVRTDMDQWPRSSIRVERHNEMIP